MKKILILVAVFFVLLFIHPDTSEARVDVNSNGSVTVTGRDIGERINKTGVATGPDYDVFSNPTYTLTQYTQYNKTGAIWMTDRLSTRDPFEFYGSIEISNPKAMNILYLERLGDGMSLIFHNDDEKMVGYYGSSLGVLGLSNAHGLVIDTYANNNAGDTYPGNAWVNNSHKRDPITAGEYYYQVWSTNSRGQGERETTGSKFKVLESLRNSKSIEVSYNPVTRYITYKIDDGGKRKEHKSYVPPSQEYFYFASTASTGGSTGTHKITIKSISYTPKRFKRLVYKDVNTNQEVKSRDIETGVIGESYNFSPSPPKGYDVVSIEGKLSGKYEYDDTFDNENIIMYVRKQPTSNVYELKTKNMLSRNDNTNQLFFEKNYIDFISLSKPVSKITFTTPKYITWDLDAIGEYNGWQKIDYTTKTKNVYQIYNMNSKNNPLPNGILSNAEMQELISRYGKFKFNPDMKDQMETDVIQLELSNDAVVLYEDSDEYGLTGYFMPYLYDQNFVKINTRENGVVNSLVDYTSNKYVYKNTNSLKTKKDQDAGSFVKRMLGSNYIATSDGYIKGDEAASSVPNVMDKYLIKFNLTNKDLGVPETKNPKLSIPQPTFLTIKDTMGNIVQERYQVGPEFYHLGDMIYQDATKLPVIEKHTFIKLEDETQAFPIKVTTETKDIVAIYESDYNYWGNVPWTFNEASGTLNLHGDKVPEAKLGTVFESPWNRGDNQKIDHKKIKVIDLVGNIKTPVNAQYLFADTYFEGAEQGNYLVNLEEIKNIESLDVSQTRDIRGMFFHAKKITELNLSNWDTTQVIGDYEMINTFSGMTSLKSISLGEKTKLLDNTGLVAKKTGNYSGKWQTVGSGSKNRPRGNWQGPTSQLEKHTREENVSADTYVWQPLLTWGNVPWSFNDSGELMLHGDEVTSPVLGDFTTSPWNIRQDYVLQATEIKKINLQGKITSSNDSNYLFSDGKTNGNYLTNLEEIKNLDTLEMGSVTRTDHMFYKVSNLSRLDLSTWNTSKVKTMDSMFDGMESLRELHLGIQTKLKTGTKLTSPKGSNYSKKWRTVGTSGSVAKPKGDWRGSALELETRTQEKLTRAEIYVWEPLVVWGSVPWSYFESGELVLHGDEVNDAYLSDYLESPWNRNDGYEIKGNLIKELTINGNTLTSYNSEYLFSSADPNKYLLNLEKITGLDSLNTLYIANYENMFLNASKLKQLDLSTWNTSQASNMNNMFGKMSNLRELHLGKQTKLLSGTGLTSPQGNNYTDKWQTVGRGTTENPKGTWSGTSIELEKRTQESLKQTDIYVWQPLVGDIYLSQYPEDYKFETRIKDKWQPVVLEPKDKEDKFISVSDERRVTSAWSLNVSAKPLTSKRNGREIEEAMFDFKTSEMMFKDNKKQRPNFNSHIELYTDNASISVMNLGALGEEPLKGEYGLKISDMKLKVPRNKVVSDEEFLSHLRWTLDAVPEF